MTFYSTHRHIISNAHPRTPIMLLIYIFRISIIIRALVGISEYMKYSMTELPITNTSHTNNTNNIPYPINDTHYPTIHVGIDYTDDIWVNVSTVINYTWIENARA